MKNKRITRLLSLILTVLLVVFGLSVTAYASGDPEGGHKNTEQTEAATNPEPDTEPITEQVSGLEPLTPDGNMTLIDDIEDINGNKQFITVVTKNGNYFYIIIDRADSGENTIHFLNQVDEADLMALMEEGEFDETTPIVCTCTDKCVAGEVNTDCPVCVNDIGECVGKESKPVETDDPKQDTSEEKDNGIGIVLVVVLIIAAGGGAVFYFFVIKPKQIKKNRSDLDDFDLEDEEYLNEDKVD